MSLKKERTNQEYTRSVKKEQIKYQKSWKKMLFSIIFIIIAFTIIIFLAIGINMAKKSKGEVMALKVGIVGLPNVGKSTVFSAITNSKAEIANYPFATISPNVGVVELPDVRLKTLAEIVKPEKIVGAAFEFIDIAGLVKGASQGEGLGNKFLANIREVDSIVQVVRCFENKEIIHVNNKIDPIFDLEIINYELILADLETINNLKQKINKKNVHDKQIIQQLDLLEKLKNKLEQGILARQIDLNNEEQKNVKLLNLLTFKPTMYVGNIAEEDIKNPLNSIHYKKLVEYSHKTGSLVLNICAKIENDLSLLNQDDKLLMMNELGIKSPGLNQLIQQSFYLLNLATFFTVGPKEVKAWTFKKGMLAPQCAGIIHTDFEKGFIRAEIIKYQDFIANNGYNLAKTNGKVNLEGKNYSMQDGDIVHFRFNV